MLNLVGINDGRLISFLVAYPPELLEQGYHVKATLRDVRKTNENKQLANLKGAKKRLTLVPVNSLEQGSFKDAVAGCSCVFHIV